MIKNLPGEQVELLEQAFKKARKRREIIRFQALLLLTEGYKRKEVAKIVKVSTHVLEDWVTAFNKAGITGLYEKPQPGNHRKLTKNQKEILKKLITTKTPENTGLAGVFWSPSLVSQLIRKEYNISYQREAARKLLHSYGLSFHKPEKVNKRQKYGDKLRFEEKLKKDSKTGHVEVIRWYW